MDALVANASLDITETTIETYRQLAKYNYECGDYQTARDELLHYISLYSKPPPATDPTTKDDEDNDEFGMESSLHFQQE